MPRGIDGQNLVEASVAPSALATYLKDYVRVATTGALPANTASSDGLTLTADADGALPDIDGVTLAEGESVLVKDEGGASPAAHTNNGIYVVTSLGGIASPWVLTRRTDANSVEAWESGGLIGNGMTTFPSEGAANALRQYVALASSPFVVGTTAIGFDTLGGAVFVTDMKEAVNAASTTALAATRSDNVLTANANGALAAIDGVSLAVGGRVLVKNQLAGADNGIYTVTTLGDGSHPWTMTRSSDADTSAEVTQGMGTMVLAGTANGSTTWVLTTADPIVLNTTSLTFAVFGGAPTFAEVNSALAAANAVITIGGNQGFRFPVDYLYPNGGCLRIEGPTSPYNATAAVITVGSGYIGGGIAPIVAMNRTPGSTGYGDRMMSILTVAQTGSIYLGSSNVMSAYEIVYDLSTTAPDGGLAGTPKHAFQVDGALKFGVYQTYASFLVPVGLPTSSMLTLTTLGQYRARGSNGQIIGYVNGAEHAIGAMTPTNYDTLVGPVTAQPNRRYYSTFGGAANNAIALPSGASCMPGDQIALKSLFSSGPGALYWEVTPDGLDAIDGVAGPRNFLADGKTSHVLEWSDNGWLVVVGGS